MSDISIGSLIFFCVCIIVISLTAAVNQIETQKDYENCLMIHNETYKLGIAHTEKGDYVKERCPYL